MCAIGTAAVVMGLALVSVAAGQGTIVDGVHNAKRLGGPTAFYTPPLRTAANLKQLAARKGMADDIRTVLRESGIPEIGDAVLATLAGATSSVRGGFCDEATPADGVIVECDVQPGSTLLWMALRPKGNKGIRTPGRLERVRWAGDKPFRAFLFRVTNDYKIYTFILPMVCSNLSLMSIKEIPGEPVNVSVDRVCDPATGNLRATVKASSKDLERVQRVSVAINGQPAGELTASSWTFTSNKPGDYTFDATDTKGRSYSVARRTIRVEVCPPPPAPQPKQVVGPTCSLVLSVIPAKGGYEINVDATKSSTGTSGVAPTVTVDLRDDAGVAVGQKLTLDSSLNGKITVRRHGTYRGTATVTTPQAVEVGAYRYEGTATCDASVTIEKPAGPSVFFDVLGGKERRVRPIGDTNMEFAQCSPLLGVKFGIAKRFKNDWELAGAVGVAISLVTDSQKVKESELFVDGELNKYMSGGAFVGTGLSLWDLTRSATWTPAWLLHFGIPLSKGDRHTVFFMGEGRLFFDHISDVSNNYQVWAGLRVKFGR
ncbi:MAG: hypothetical protein NT151_06050 [Acidobacteria bacterium]|nr:hypothetical protein [Acidobacteriota bacterium]